MKINRTKRTNAKVNKGKAVFIIPAAIIAVIFVAVIIVVITADNSKNDKSGQADSKSKIKSVSEVAVDTESVVE